MSRHSHDILSIFHPLVAKWFQDRIGNPTDIQIRAWPYVSRGDNVLITAPTGSGKTLTAFLWALNQLITGHSPSGYTRVLYVSPLKALNNDIKRNLIDPLKGRRPKRVAGTHLVYRGSRLILISQRMGKKLTIHTSPEDPELHEYFVVLRHLLNRKFQPKRRITIETINDEPAPKSPYINALRIQFDVLVDFKTVTLYRKQES
jgi:hypothetical protein